MVSSDNLTVVFWIASTVSNAEKTLAIVIRLVEYSESSYVATLFTQSHGKITGLAKGARRPKGSFENALDLLAISRVVFLSKSSGAMELLTEAKLERRFRAALRDSTRLYAGYYVMELLNALTDERDPHPDLFRSTVRAIVSLDREGDVGREVVRFEMAVLRDLGQLPSFDRCVECGELIRPDGRIAFGQLAGGVLCPRCRPGQRHVASLSRPAAEWLAKIVKDLDVDNRTTDTDLQGEIARERGVPRGAVGKYSAIGMSKRADGLTTLQRTERAVRGEVRGLMTHRMSHVLGRRPKMHAFLSMLR